MIDFANENARCHLAKSFGLDPTKIGNGFYVQIEDKIKMYKSTLYIPMNHVHDADCLLAADWYDYSFFFDDIKPTIKSARLRRMEAWNNNKGATEEVRQILMRL